jgi:NTE family protein
MTKKSIKIKDIYSEILLLINKNKKIIQYNIPTNQNTINTINTINLNMKYINKTILVLSGGGMRGLAYFGALKALDELNILSNIHTFAAASVGGLLIIMHIIGYTTDELYDFLKLFDFTKLTMINSSNLFTKFGLDDGMNIIKITNYIFKNKNIDENITFLELYNLTKKTLYLSTVCINDKSLLYLSYITTPNLKVIDGLRMTSAVPIYFAPFIYENKMYIDGGCIDNYPINLFKNTLSNVIGLFLNANVSKYEQITNLETYFIECCMCMLEGINRNLVLAYEEYTIQIYIDNISILNFGIEYDFKLEAYEIGYNTVKKYFEKIVHSS